jgi:hypothetical protein
MYAVLGFATAFFPLEAAWQFTACKNKSLKPFSCKRIGIL